MDIYSLDYKTVETAINNKNKKIINQFIKLPNTIKKKFIYEDLNLDNLIEQINISDYCDIISMFQNDIIMFEKIYVKMLLNIKKNPFAKYRDNKIKNDINNIGNYFISHLMVVIEQNNISNFKKIINKQKEILHLWNLTIQKDIKKNKLLKQKNKQSLMHKIVELYDKEFQKLSIYIASINKDNFLNIVIESNFFNINYKFLLNIIDKYPHIFFKLYRNNENIQKFIHKNILKFMHILSKKKIDSIVNKYIDLNNYFFFTFSKEIITKNITIKDIRIIDMQKNIIPENKCHFLEIIKYISKNINSKYITEYLENNKNNLSDKHFIELLDFSNKESILINYNKIFKNYLDKGKIKILQNLIDNYQLNKVSFDFIMKKLLPYNDSSWSQKYNIKYCIHFMIDNSLLEEPDKNQSFILFNFIKQNQGDGGSEYSFSSYWERNIFQKLWTFLINTCFINIILEIILKKINNEDIQRTEECPICYCKITREDYKLSCNHCFHKECISEYYKNKNYSSITNIQNQKDNIVLDCPYCRYSVLEI